VEVIGFEVAITQYVSFIYFTQKYNGMQKSEILKNVNNIDIQRCSDFSQVCSMARIIPRE
jgi:hypothetical protein